MNGKLLAINEKLQCGVQVCCLTELLGAWNPP